MCSAKFLCFFPLHHCLFLSVPTLLHISHISLSGTHVDMFDGPLTLQKLPWLTGSSFLNSLICNIEYIYSMLVCFMLNLDVLRVKAVNYLIVHQPVTPVFMPSVHRWISLYFPLRYISAPLHLLSSALSMSSLAWTWTARDSCRMFCTRNPSSG